MKELLKNFKYIVDNHNSFVVLFDKSYEVIYVNQAYSDFFGIKVKKLIGKSFFPLILQADHEKIKKSLSEISPNNPSTNHQERIICKSGIKWVDWSVKGIFSLTGTLEYYASIGTDITPLKKLEKELLIINERYLQAEIIGKVGNWEYDLSKEVFWASEGSRRLYGFPEDIVDMSPQKVESRIPERERVHQALVDLIEHDKPYDLEFEIKPMDDIESRIISSVAELRKDKSGKPLKITGVINDVTKQKEMETLLKKSEKQYRNLFESASDAIYLITLNGIFIDVNKASCKMLGRTKEKTMKLNIVDIDPSYSQDQFSAFWSDLPYQQPIIFNTKHLHCDGSLIPIELSGTKFIIDEEIVIYGIARDISKRIKAEEKLRTSEERFKLAVEGTQDGLWDWNLKTDYTYHSDRFATMLGYEPDELPYTSKAWSDLLHPNDKDKALKQVENYLNNPKNVYESTFRMKCKGDYYRWIKGRGKAIFDENGKPTRFVGFNTDITNRKNAERSFIKSTEKFHKLFENLLEGVVFFNNDGRITDANPAALKILGLDMFKLKGKLLNSPTWNIVDEDRKKMTSKQNPILHTLQTGINLANITVGMKLPSHIRRLWLSVSTTAIYEDDHDAPTKVYVTFIDVTEKKISEENILKLTDSLQAAQELAGLGYWRFDIKNQQPTWSNKMFEIFGVKKSDGTPDYQSHKVFWHPEDWNYFDEAVKKCIAGTPYDMIVRVIFPDESIHYVHTIGKPRFNQNNEVIELFGTSQDVTDIKIAENELRIHKENLEELVKNRTKELEEKNKTLTHYYELFNTREFRIKELRDEVAALKAKLADKVIK